MRINNIYIYIYICHWSSYKNKIDEQKTPSQTNIIVSLLATYLHASEIVIQSIKKHKKILIFNRKFKNGNLHPVCKSLQTKINEQKTSSQTEILKKDYSLIVFAMVVKRKYLSRKYLHKHIRKRNIHYDLVEFLKFTLI